MISKRKKKEEKYKKNEEEEQRTQTSNKVKMTAEKLWWRHFNKGCRKEKEQLEPAYSEDYLSSQF